MVFQELAEVGDGFPGAGAGVDTGDDVGGGGVAVGAATAGSDGVEGAVEEGDVGYALEVTFRGDGGGKPGGDSGAVAGLIKFGDAAGAAAEVGADGGKHLGAGADGGDGATGARLGDIEIAVGTKFQAAGRFESRSVNGGVGGKLRNGGA